MTTPQIANDLLIDRCEFNLTPEVIGQIANIRDQVADLLKEKGVDQLIADARSVYDFIQGLERQGLRGRDLFLAFKDNHELFKLHNDYFYLFYSMGSWATRIGKVLTSDGELFPADDLLVGELAFGITKETIEDSARPDSPNYRREEELILQEEGVDYILAEVQKLYDAARNFESQGLRGDDLGAAIRSDATLLAICKRYYGFMRVRIWGYRMQEFKH